MIQKILTWDILSDKMSLTNFLYQQGPENGAYTVFLVIPLETTVRKPEDESDPTKFVITKATCIFNPIPV